MKDLMKYKGYFGSAHFSDDDNLFYGKLEFIRALVSYKGTDVKTLRRAFEEAVDEYLQMCREAGDEPEKPLKGSFNVRVGSNLHQRVALNALSKGITINKYINEVLEKAVQCR